MTEEQIGLARRAGECPMTLDVHTLGDLISALYEAFEPMHEPETASILTAWCLVVFEGPAAEA